MSTLDHGRAAPRKSADETLLRSEMFTLAHLSDPHFGPMPPLGIGALMNKRILGYLSWNLRRKVIHRLWVMAALSADLRETRPDHVAITGDLVNIALPAEFSQAAEWLRRLGEPDAVTVIPGNHDTYVTVPWENSLALWAEYMSGERTDGQTVSGPPEGLADFPIVRIRGRVAIIGLCSAHPTSPISAVGTLGEAQLATLEGLLVELGRERLFRVVLIHHAPISSGGKWRKRLVDAEAFQTIIGRTGAGLILHGHVHRLSTGRIPTPTGSVPVMAVPSATAAATRPDRAAHYHIYEISRDKSGWRLWVTARGLDETKRNFIAKGRYAIEVSD